MSHDDPALLNPVRCSWQSLTGRKCAILKTTKINSGEICSDGSWRCRLHTDAAIEAAEQEYLEDRRKKADRNAEAERVYHSKLVMDSEALSKRIAQLEHQETVLLEVVKKLQARSTRKDRIDLMARAKSLLLDSEPNATIAATAEAMTNLAREMRLVDYARKHDSEADNEESEESDKLPKWRRVAP